MTTDPPKSLGNVCTCPTAHRRSKRGRERATPRFNVQSAIAECRTSRSKAWLLQQQSTWICRMEPAVMRSRTIYLADRSTRSPVVSSVFLGALRQSEVSVQIQTANGSMTPSLCTPACIPLRLLDGTNIDSVSDLLGSWPAFCGFLYLTAARRAQAVSARKRESLPSVLSSGSVARMSGIKWSGPRSA